MAHVEKTPVRTVGKLWGSEQWLVNNESYCLKILTLHPGFTSSLHYHRGKKETFIIKKGFCFLELEKGIGVLGGNVLETVRLEQGDSITISPGRKHRFYLPHASKKPCVIYEASTRHKDDDVVRETESQRLREDDPSMPLPQDEDGVSR